MDQTHTCLLRLCNQEKVAKAQEVKDLAVSNLTQAVEDEKKEQWRAEGRQMLFDAKRVSKTISLRLMLSFLGRPTNDLDFDFEFDIC